MKFLGGLGGGQDVDAGGFKGADWPMAEILGPGRLSDCDGILGVAERCCGVTGGFPTDGLSSESNSSGFTGVDVVTWLKEGRLKFRLYLFPLRSNPLCSSKRVSLANIC